MTSRISSQHRPDARCIAGRSGIYQVCEAGRRADQVGGDHDSDKRQLLDAHKEPRRCLSGSAGNFQNFPKYGWEEQATFQAATCSSRFPGWLPQVSEPLLHFLFLATPSGIDCGHPDSDRWNESAPRTQTINRLPSRSPTATKQPPAACVVPVFTPEYPSMPSSRLVFFQSSRRW